MDMSIGTPAGLLCMPSHCWPLSASKLHAMYVEFRVQAAAVSGFNRSVRTLIEPRAAPVSHICHARKPECQALHFTGTQVWRGRVPSTSARASPTTPDGSANAPVHITLGNGGQWLSTQVLSMRSCMRTSVG